MNLNDARRIGQDKLSIDRRLFDKCMQAAKEMGVRAEDAGPMVLALGIMGLARVDKQGMESELTDALALVSRAEKEWRLEQRRH